MEKIILVQEEPRGPSYMIEIPVTVNGTMRVALPDVPQLRNTSDQIIVIKAIRVVTLDVLTFAPVGGQANAPLAELKKISLVLYSDGWEKGQYIPALVLNDVATPAGTFPYRNNPTKFSSWRNLDWNKSYLTYSNGSGGAAGAPYAVLLEVEYVKFQKMNDGSLREIVGPSS